MTFSPLSVADVERIKHIFVDQGLEIQMHDDALEFSFKGRDMSNSIVKAFVAVAAILHNADGELRCEIDDEGNDPHFEFFTISKSRLWMQKGHIVRGETVEILP